MENENKNIPENGGAENNAKKPNIGMIAAIAGGAVVVIVGIVVAILLLGKKPEECVHKDANDDKKCDICGEAYEDGDENTDIQKKNYAVTVKDNSGNRLPGAKLLLTAGGEKVEITSDDEGNATAALYPVKYSVTMVRPEDEGEVDPFTGFILETVEIDASAAESGIEIILINNNRDGSEEKPFFISEYVTEITVKAGEEIFYECRNNSLVRTLTILNENLSVNYNGNEYKAVSGKIEVQITSSEDFNNYVTFSVKNKSASDVVTDMEFVFPLGSRENPILFTANPLNAVVVAGGSINYLWVADKTGILVVTSTDYAKNNIGLENRTTSVVAPTTDGSEGEYLFVTEGDEVVISVSLRSNEESGTVSLNLNVYEGTESDPIPVLKNEFEIKLDAGSSYTFKAAEGKTVTTTDGNVTVTVNGEVKTPNQLNIINAKLEGTDLFTVTNTSDEALNFEIKIA